MILRARAVWPVRKLARWLRARSWVAASSLARRYATVGLLVTIAFGLALGGLGLFGWVAEEMHKGHWDRLDPALMLALHSVNW
jgi:hypothetical protein